MSYVAAAISFLLFAWSLKRTRAVETATGAVSVARSTMAVLLDATLSDREKERVARAGSCKLAVAAAKVIGGLAVAAASALSFLGLLVWPGLVRLGTLVPVLESWSFIAFSVIVFITMWLWQR